jgi:hypothetical protein
MKTIFTDGAKSVNIPVDFDSDFGWEVAGDMGKVEDAELYAKVAAVYRAAHINADALASLPFALVTESGEDYDTSEKWQNKIGFLPNPRKLLRLWRLSLFATNSAYGYIDDKRKPGMGKVRELRYIVPTSIEIDADENGISKFIRRIGGQTKDWKPDDPRLVYLHRLDWDTELLPSENTEFKACLNSVRIMYNADYFVSKFFERQGIKPTFVFVKGVPKPDDKKRLENFVDRLMRGLTRTVGKVFNAESVEVKQIGSGVDDLKDNAQYRQAIENVAMATGIPLSLLLANSANMATAQQEYASWFRDSVTPWAEFIADEWNACMFTRLGLKIEFRPEASEPGQEEEVRRAEAANKYYAMLSAAGHAQPLKLAFQITGVDLPPDVDIDSLDVKPEPEPAPVVVAAEEQPEAEPEQQPAPAVRFLPTFEQFEELKLWRDKAFRALKQDKPQPLEFECTEVPADFAADIRVKLAGVKGERDIRAAFEFEQVTPAPGSDEIKMLADALNRLAERPVEVKAAPHQPVTFNLSAVMPAPGEPSITFAPEIKQAPATVIVNVPEQPAPNVSVVNEIRPADNVNNITVQPADVTINAPQRAKVKRDMNGRIDEIVSD